MEAIAVNKEEPTIVFHTPPTLFFEPVTLVCPGPCGTEFMPGLRAFVPPPPSPSARFVPWQTLFFRTMEVEFFPGGAIGTIAAPNLAGVQLDDVVAVRQLRYCYAPDRVLGSDRLPPWNRILYYARVQAVDTEAGTVRLRIERLRAEEAELGDAILVRSMHRLTVNVQFGGFEE